MSAAVQPNLIAPPERLAVPTCIGCGAIRRPGTCDATCREQRLEVVPAGAYDELAAVRSSIRACADAFRAVAEALAMRQATATQYESAYRSVRDQACAALHRFPEPRGLEDVLQEAAEPTTAWWCADCGGVDAPQSCLEFCIWRLVEWVSAASYQEERERALSDRVIEARLRGLVRRVASVTPREDQWGTCWHALQAEARRTLEVSDEAASSAPLAARARSRNGAGSRDSATIDGPQNEEYQRGREDGIAWACNYATADELRDLVEDSRPSRSADFDRDHSLCEFVVSGKEDADIVSVSHYDNPHWRGFVAGAEEVLDSSGQRPRAGAALPATTATASALTTP